MEENTIPIEKPIGDWILKQNISGTQTHNGVYYHYSEVCNLLKLMKKECESQKSNTSERQLTIPDVSQRSELLLSAICQFTKRTTQKEIQEVEKWIETDFRK